MEPTRSLGVQGPSVRALKKIDEQGLPCSPIFDDKSEDGDTIKWTENMYGSGSLAGAKKRSRKVKREVLREERRRVEKRHLSRLQTDNAHSIQTRCRKTSRKLSDGSYFINLYS